MKIVKIEIQNKMGYIIPDEKEDFARIPQGHFTLMSCGHRGTPCRLEEKRISRLLRKSGFIPMLEEQN